jgi:hypothetical protein
MARVFLHIGAHKTGTTYLQNLFHLNRDRLEAEGIFYPDIGPNTAHHALARSWIDMPDVPDSFYGEGGPDGLWQQLIDRHAGTDDTLFLSAENFSRAKPQVINWVDLAQRLSAFAEVKIIYAMRTQVELVQALWLQLAKTSRVIDLPACVRTAVDERRVVGVGVDHYAVYGTLRHGFAADQIHLLDYGQVRRAPGGIGQVFLDLLGSRLRAEALEQPPTEDANISPDPLGYWIATQIAGKTKPGPQLEAITAEIIGSAERPTTLLSREEYKRLDQRYAAGNAYLAQTVQAAQPGFSFIQPEPPENLLYRDDISPSMWIRIAAALYQGERDTDAQPSLLGQLRDRLSR